MTPFSSLRARPPDVERLDAARMRHGCEHIAHVGELIERAAEPQHLLGRSLVERTPGAVTELGLERALWQRMVTIAAERTIDEMLVRLTRRSRDPQTGIEMIVSRAPQAVIGLRIHFGRERPRG